MFAYISVGRTFSKDGIEVLLWSYSYLEWGVTSLSFYCVQSCGFSWGHWKQRKQPVNVTEIWVTCFTFDSLLTCYKISSNIVSSFKVGVMEPALMASFIWKSNICASHCHSSIYMTAADTVQWMNSGSHCSSHSPYYWSYLVCLMRSMTSCFLAALRGLGVGSSSAGLTAT